MDCGVVRVELQCLAQARRGLFQATPLQQHAAEITVRRDTSRIVKQHGAQACFRFFQPLQPRQGDSQVEPRIGIRRIEFQRAPVAGLGFIQPAEFLQCHAEVVMRFDVVRRQRDRSLHRQDRIRVLAQKLERHPHDLPGECMFRETRGHPLRVCNDFQVATRLQQSDYRFHVRLVRAAAARRGVAHLAGIDARQQGIDRVAFQPVLPGERQHAARIVAVTRTQQRINVVQPELRTRRIGIQRGGQIGQSRLGFARFQGDHAEIVVCIGVIRPALQDGLIQLPRLEQASCMLMFECLLQQRTPLVGFNLLHRDSSRHDLGLASGVVNVLCVPARAVEAWKNPVFAAYFPFHALDCWRRTRSAHTAASTRERRFSFFSTCFT